MINNYPWVGNCYNNNNNNTWVSWFILDLIFLFADTFNFLRRKLKALKLIWYAIYPWVGNCYNNNIPLGWEEYTSSPGGGGGGGGGGARHRRRSSLLLLLLLMLLLSAAVSAAATVPANVATTDADVATTTVAATDATKLGWGRMYLRRRATATAAFIIGYYLNRDINWINWEFYYCVLMGKQISSIDDHGDR